jgi:hypothetical protein
MGVRMKERMVKKTKIAETRNKQILNIMKEASCRIVNWFNEKKKIISRNKPINENLSFMVSSIQENILIMKHEDNYENEIVKHTEKEIENWNKVVKQFENDNTFFFDKRCWERMKSLDLTIEHKGTNLMAKKYKEVKTILRRGIKLKYYNMLKIKNMMQCTFVDSIDQGRVNRYYFNCLKEMKMFNRIAKFEKWLINQVWKNEITKKVNHRHYSNYNFFKQKKSKFKNPVAVTLQDSDDFKIINKSSSSSVNKAINYLKWNRNKFKIHNGKVKAADIINLKLKETAYGIQKEENNYVIWKHVLKWKKYAEINLFDEGILFEVFNKKKRRKKVETIFN